LVESLDDVNSSILSLCSKTDPTWQLASSRSSLSRRSRALDTLERVLANICVSHGSTPVPELDTFLKLQDGFECNGVYPIVLQVPTQC
jgi:hypothetical protein